MTKPKNKLNIKYGIIGAVVGLLIFNYFIHAFLFNLLISPFTIGMSSQETIPITKTWYYSQLIAGAVIGFLLASGKYKEFIKKRRK